MKKKDIIPARHKNEYQSQRKEIDGLNRSFSVHSSHSSTIIRNDSNKINPHLQKMKKENNNRPHPIPSQQNPQNNKSLKQTNQPKVTIIFAHTDDNNNNQATKSTSEGSIQRHFQASNLIHPQTTLIEKPNSLQNSPKPIHNLHQSSTNKNRPNSIRSQLVIPELDFSNLPNFENDPEYPRCPMAPRFIFTRLETVDESLFHQITFASQPLQARSARRPYKVRELLMDYTISSSDKQNKIGCVICLCNFDKDEKVSKLQCGHIFHKECILSWLNKGPSIPTCPMCRQRLHKII